MTTEAAALRYKENHMAENSGRKIAVFNPHSKPIDDLPVIYGFNNGGSRQCLGGELISEDGEWLGSHICSDEAYMPHDLGILEGTRPDRHETFKSKYPYGYRMEFVRNSDVKEHEKLNKAVSIARKKEDKL